MKTVLQSLNQALLEALASDPCVLLLGEDILDPYGGAFKVTQGCSTAFPDRVLATPISEAAIVGIAAGMAMRGLRPVVEIMFGDFIPLIADQVINHASKFRWMYNDQVRVPMVIRTPMGGRRGYGPTHSQSLEKLVLGIPGLTVIAPLNIGDPGKLLLHAILNEEDPVIFLENKLLYPLPILDQKSSTEFSVKNLSGNQPYPTYQINIRSAPPPRLTITAYGYMVELACRAMLKLAYEHEIFCELVAPTQLSPFNVSEIQLSVSSTKRLLTVEEGTLTLGWGAEVLARVTEKLGTNQLFLKRLASAEHPIPASPPLESQSLPGLDDIVSAVIELVNL
ncbi:MAG: alpha-ketoacid dehydrogenase subunit beta [Chloroflexota bacterium]